MPDVQAQTADGVIHSFPDGTPNEVVDRAVKQYLASRSGAPQSGFQGRTGGKIFASADEYLKAQGEQERAGELVGEKAIAGSIPGGELTVGAEKGLMHTGRTLGRALTKLPLVGPKIAEAWPEAASGETPEQFKPHGAAQKIGFGGEQAAEFMTPGGAVSKGAKMADAAVDAAKLAPWLGKLLKLGARSGLEAGSSAAVTAAQGGDVGTNTAIAAALPPAGKLLKVGATALSEEVAPRVANKLLRPVPTQLENAARFGRNPGQAIVDEGIVATGHADLLDKIAVKKEEVGVIIGNTLKNAAKAGKVIDAKAAIEKPINDAVQDVISGKIEGGDAMIQKLEELRNQLLSVRQLQNGKLVVTGAKNMTLAPDAAHALKRQIGDGTKWSDDAMTRAVNDVKRSIYRNLNDEIEKAVPGVKADQMRYGNLLEAEKSAERELARREARNSFSFTDYILAAGSGLGELLRSGNTAEGVAAAAGMATAARAMRSPLAKTLEVQGMKNAPKAVNPGVLRALRNAVFGGESAARQ